MPDLESSSLHSLTGLRRLVLVTLLSFSSLTAVACDSQKTEDLPNAIECYILSLCYQENTRFGMVGDSWTDFGLGIQIQRDLRDWLVFDHGYQMTEVVLAGQTLEADLNQARGFQRVIQNAGPELKYMLLSLGGNDLLDNINEYGSAADPATVRAARLSAYEANLRNMIAQGDFLKIQLYGGAPLTWILHGYDYANPEKVTGCNLTTGSFTATQKEELFRENLDEYNALQQTIAGNTANVHWIDLRGTLGGPSVSNPNLKLDCIHPNDAGFQAVAARYAAALQTITPER